MDRCNFCIAEEFVNSFLLFWIFFSPIPEAEKIPELWKTMILTQVFRPAGNL